MKVVIQRVSQAKVKIDHKTVGEIDRGFVILLGIHQEDTKLDADYLVRKISKLRVFEDDEGKMNRSILEADGSVLSISQFTLYGETKKGNRPSFIEAARPEVATPLYEYFNEQLKAENISIETGEFGADMQVELTNDGPVTIIIDTRNK